MSSIGTGYDLSASQFSPDGRIFQVEYAIKAVENSGTAVALRCKDGVVFAVEKLVTSTLLEEFSNRRIFNVDKHIGVAIAGLLADARQLIEAARDEASDYRSSFGGPIPLKTLAERVAMYAHSHTLYSAIRPFGCSILMGSFQENKPALYMIDPSGVTWGYHGCSVGKAQQSAKTEIEKLLVPDKHLNNMTCTEAIKEIAKIIHIIHDEIKDKTFELELSWVGDVTNGKHVMVPQDIAQDAFKFGKEAMVESSSSDDEDI